ncbi:hypothetical protein [Winogradskyella forsetii]|uniref:hypothetical protein n=1 Tax=Winogradskyella forsetii TaxID=2686077 RepID=UPI0015BC8ADD|nr:hypothetical protein [Winogradskyella forsetii]
MKNFRIASILIFTFFALNAQVNLPDASINLALSPDAELIGSVTNGRGKPIDIFYNPQTENYETKSSFAEYGVSYNKAVDTFYLKIKWTSAKLINYITLGGTYPSQPQTDTAWKISYLKNGKYIVLDEGVGGWIDSGIYENNIPKPILTNELIISTGKSRSIHFRGRGSNARYSDSFDSETETKAVLIQLLPYEDSNNEIAELKEKVSQLKIDLNGLEAKTQIQADVLKTIISDAKYNKLRDSLKFDVLKKKFKLLETFIIENIDKATGDQIELIDD